MRIVSSALALAVLVAAPRAEAQPSATAAAATAQFDTGRKLLKQGKYAEACAAFEQSQKLEPAPGTLYNLAGCYVKLGKLASAWATYRALAQTDPNPARKADSDKQARALERRLPRLEIDVEHKPAGLVVTLDGVDVTAGLGAANPVDLGDVEIRATAPHYREAVDHAKLVAENQTVVIRLVLEPAPVAPPPPEPVHAQRPSAPPPPPAAPSHRRTVAAIVGVGGVAIVATGLVFGQLARGAWADAKAACGGDLACDTAADLQRGNALAADARSRATTSTVLVAGGAVALGAAAILWLTAPARGVHVAPQADATQVGLVLGGTF